MKETKSSIGEELFAKQLYESMGHSHFNKLVRTEYQFAKDIGRRWRFDFAIILNSAKIAVEIEGATWSNGRHTRGAGFSKDCEKYNMAAYKGWQVYRFTTGDVKDGTAIDFIKNVLSRYVHIIGSGYNPQLTNERE